MAIAPIPRRLLVALAAAASVIVTAGGGSVAATSDGDRGAVSVRVAERIYLDCIDGAPTTPDSHERWVASCRDLAAVRSR